MKEIQLSKGRIAIVDDEDHAAVVSSKWYVWNGYAIRHLGLINGVKKSQKMHRMIMGEPSGLEIDHINGNKLDNRRSNLRACTRQQNKLNRGPYANNKSGMKGVSWHAQTSKWRATIRFNNKITHLGLFNSKDAAHHAYSEAASRLHGDFAKTS